MLEERLNYLSIPPIVNITKLSYEESVKEYAAKKCRKISIVAVWPPEQLRNTEEIPPSLRFPQPYRKLILAFW